jgi:hypothetical protein
MTMAYIQEPPATVPVVLENWFAKMRLGSECG